MFLRTRWTINLQYTSHFTSLFSFSRSLSSRILSPSIWMSRLIHPNDCECGLCLTPHHEGYVKRRYMSNTEKLTFVCCCYTIRRLWQQCHSLLEQLPVVFVFTPLVLYKFINVSEELVQEKTQRHLRRYSGFILHRCEYHKSQSNSRLTL